MKHPKRVTSHTGASAFSRNSSSAGTNALSLIAAVAVLAVFSLAGCATVPEEKPQPEPVQEPEPAKPVETEKPAEPAKPPEPVGVVEARTLIEAATIESLADAARLLHADSLAGNASAANLAGAGRAISDGIYPELPNPFAADTSAFSDKGPGASDFLRTVIPSIPLVVRGAAIEEAKAAQLEAGLKKADELNPQSTLPPYLLALLSEQQGKNRDAALALYRECLKRAPSFYPAKARAAENLSASGMPAEALPLIREFVAALPPDVGRFRVLARAALAGGEPQEAADTAARALLLAPETSDLVILRAQAFEKLGNWYQAMSILDALLKRKPDESMAVLIKARLLWQKSGDSDQAVRVLAKAESDFPSDPAFPELRGEILLAKGMREQGIGKITRALALEPGRPYALALLAAQAARDGEWAQASAWLERIPRESLAVGDLLLGWRAATELGDHDRALGFARDLGSKFGGEMPILLEARSLLALGRGAEALEAVDEGLGVVKSPANRSSLFVVRSQSGSDDPLRDLRFALYEDPDNVEALSAIAARFIDAGEKRKALGYLKRAAALSPDDEALSRRVEELGQQLESEQ
jgi:tetratricopeptide (TPR) repeat protein